MTEQPGDYRLVLRPTPADSPPEKRLALLLKWAGRRLGLRCVRVEVVAEKGADDGTGQQDPVDGPYV